MHGGDLFKGRESQGQLHAATNGKASDSLERFPLVAAGAAATEGAVECEVDVLLAVHAHHEGGNVHNLLAHPVIKISCSVPR